MVNVVAHEYSRALARWFIDPFTARFREILTSEQACASHRPLVAIQSSSPLACFIRESSTMASSDKQSGFVQRSLSQQ